MRYLFGFFVLFVPFLGANDLAALRLNDYRNFIKQIAAQPRELMLKQVNLYFNRIVNEYDINNWGVEDYWSTPKEFIVRGSGDCEDFVIAKYFTLKALGIKPSDMMIYIVKVTDDRDFHAVLGVKSDHNETLILDNISWKILPIQKRTDLKILYDITNPKLCNSTDPLTRHVLENFKRVCSKIDIGN